jgi:hypothetical protein
VTAAYIAAIGLSASPSYRFPKHTVSSVSQIHNQQISYTYDNAGNILKREVFTENIKGDVNGNGVVDLAEGLYVLQIVAGLR